MKQTQSPYKRREIFVPFLWLSDVVERPRRINSRRDGVLGVVIVYPITSRHRVGHEIITLENKYRMVAPSFRHSPWNPPEIFVRIKIAVRLIWCNGESEVQKKRLFRFRPKFFVTSYELLLFAAIIFLVFCFRPVCFTFYLNKVSVFSLLMSLHSFLTTRSSKFTDASDPTEAKQQRSFDVCTAKTP